MFPDWPNVSGAEADRVRAIRDGARWRAWGPYLGEREWGTVSEDYGEFGDAWSYFPYDHARSRAYRWSEDGLAGFCDEDQRVCIALALWNGADPFLKERLFGLSNADGNHGEDVKEYYFYLDAVPSHAYQRFLYKYPQRAFPYDDLVRVNRERSAEQREYELIDTRIFDENRYFDVTVEYAKADTDDILLRIHAVNRGPDPAPLHLLPTIWFRNTWSWAPFDEKPEMRVAPWSTDHPAVTFRHPLIGMFEFLYEGAPRLLFTENTTNRDRLWGTRNQTEYVKDAFHDAIVNANRRAIDPEMRGTKAAGHYSFVIEPGEQATVRCRLRLQARTPAGPPFAGFDDLIERRRTEADHFYESVTPSTMPPEERHVLRQAISSSLWSKQFYHFNADQWLAEHAPHAMRPPNIEIRRTVSWPHFRSYDVVAVPDTWEYPSFSSWDLPFSMITHSMVDSDFAKDQIDLILAESHRHPSGRLPAYEWNFNAVCPPVHAWVVGFIYGVERVITGSGDIDWLERTFRLLADNFSWWINRRDPEGRTLLQGAVLGFDNIGVFDRNTRLPTGGYIEEADSMAWMALNSQAMLQIALELAAHDRAYDDAVMRFISYSLALSAAIDRDGGDGLWDDEQGFFFDRVRHSDGSSSRLRVRSLAGLLPLCATTILPPEVLERRPNLSRRLGELVDRRADLFDRIHDPRAPGVGGRLLLALVDERRLRRLLESLLDENQFLGPYGIRSLSRTHHDAPFELKVHGVNLTVGYDPADNVSTMFGGNTNWRGPVWIQANVILLRALLVFYAYYGNSLRVECPTGSGQHMTLYEAAEYVADRLVRLFLPDSQTAERPASRRFSEFSRDPHWRDLVPFHEFFDGDDGTGLGALHLTGSTGAIAQIMYLRHVLSAEAVLDGSFVPGLGAFDPHLQVAPRP